MIPRLAARPLLVELLPPESSAAPVAAGTAGAAVAVGVLDVDDDDDEELVRG